MGFYTYATARLFLPLLGIGILFIFKKEILWFGLKKITATTVLLFLLLAPFLKDSILGGGLHRFSYINIFSDSNLKYEINRSRLIDAIHGREQTVGMKTPLLAYFFHNKPISWIWTIINNYFSSFSTTFLFLKGDPNLRHGIGNFGGLLVATALFLLIGIIKIFRMAGNEGKGIFSKKIASFWIIFLFLTPIPSSITYDGGVHATRLFLMVIPLTTLTTVGFYEFLSCFSKKNKFLFGGLSLFFVVLNSIFYFHYYFYHYPIDSEKFWHYGFKQSTSLIKENEAGMEKVILTNTYEPPLIFFLFWEKYDPQDFPVRKLQKTDENWFEGQKIDKFYFGKINFSLLDKYLSKQIKEGKIEKILFLVGRNDFGGDLEKEIPFYLKVIDKVEMPSKIPVFYLLKTRTLEEIKSFHSKI